MGWGGVDNVEVNAVKVREMLRGSGMDIMGGWMGKGGQGKW